LVELATLSKEQKNHYKYYQAFQTINFVVILNRFTDTI